MSSEIFPYSSSQLQTFAGKLWNLHPRKCIFIVIRKIIVLKIWNFGLRYMCIHFKIVAPYIPGTVFRIQWFIIAYCNTRNPSEKDRTEIEGAVATAVKAPPNLCILFLCTAVRFDLRLWPISERVAGTQVIAVVCPVGGRRRCSTSASWRASLDWCSWCTDVHVCTRR